MLDLHQELRYLTLLLTICTDELLSTPKTITFLPQSKFGSEKSDRESNPIPYSDEQYLSGSLLVVKLTASNKQSFKVKSAFKSGDHVSNSKTIIKFLILLGVKVTLSCFKELTLDSALTFELYHLTFGERHLYAAIEGLIFFHLTTL